MAFSKEVVEKLLVACHRHCCICHKPSGSKMEIHHIVPKSEGGEDTEENGIPLCFDCHADVESYNPKHPKGRRYTSSELRKHKEQWFSICMNPPWEVTKISQEVESVEIPIINDEIFNILREDDRRPAERLVNAIMRQERAIRRIFAERVMEIIHTGDENTRWKFAFIIEDLIIWEPHLVPISFIEEMARDSSFTVRSSAAVCFYYLTKIIPDEIPLDILSELASYNEDWYVSTPATGALLRLARARPVIVDILAKDLNSEDSNARVHSAEVIQRLCNRDWDLITHEIIEIMSKCKEVSIQKVARECIKKKNSRYEPEKDYAIF
jgi:hypothetical protein